ncbi:MAG TPA: hypothetical protein VNN98_03945, partial [Rhizomicrobium sp.]|nr:hypothetical protein [Rhizomicrobium sp.]
MNAISIARGDAPQRKVVALAPAVAAMAYPFVLQAFHLVISPPAPSPIRLAGAAALLVLAFALPLSGL